MRARLRHALLAGLLVGAIGTLLALTPVGTAVESELGLQWLFNLRGAVQPPDDAVIVSVGERALDRLERKARGQPLQQCIVSASRRPGVWPRCLYAELIEKLSAQGARLIALDVYFTKRGEADGDLELARAIERAGRVLLLQRTSLEYDRIRSVRVETLSSPLSDFADAALGTGPFPLPKVPARVDQFWTFKAAFDDAPTLPALALRAYAGDASEMLLDVLRRLGAPLRADPDTATGKARFEKTYTEEMRSIRRFVRSRPGIADQVRAALQAETGTRSDGDRRRLALALIELYAGDDSRYLNLYGPAGTIRILSADDILAPGAAGRLDLDEVRDKAVFVGLAEQERVEQEDDFHTVFSRDDGLYLSGVEIAATAFLNLLHGTSLRTPNNLAVAVLIGGFGIAVTLLIYALKVAYGLAASLAIATIYATGAFYGFVVHGLWLPTLTPLALQLPLGIAAGIFLHYHSERAERERLYDEMRVHLSELGAEAVSRSGLATAPNEFVRGVILATDIEHYTTLVERTRLAELAPLMDEYMEAITEAVARHHGYVVNLRGDSVMCIWRDRHQSSEPSRLACLAALDIDAAVERFNQRHPAHRMPTRIGLDLGDVRLGDVGGKRRRTYTVEGDPVNTASRIENLSKHLRTRILASAAVIEGVEDILVRRVGTYLLEGKSNPTAVFEVLGSREVMPEDNQALCSSFTEALAVFERGQWSEAAKRLRAHCAAYSDDGAAEFLRDRSQTYVDDPPAWSDPWIIRMDEK